MTSGAKKEKARKKARAQKLLEEQRRVEEETAQRAPVSTPIPLPAAAAPLPESFPPTIHDPTSTFDCDERIHGIHDPPAFPPGHPSAHWPAHVRAFVYGPGSRSPSPPPSWYDDTPDIATIHTVYISVAPSPRDFSALRSESAHPWRTIRRRHHRLLPQRRDQRPFPRSLPKKTPPTPIPAVVHTVIADTTPLLPRHVLFDNDAPPVSNPILVADNPPYADEPIPALVLPRPMRLPWDPYHFIPTDYPTADRSLPGETFYGAVQSGLALVCAREYPWIEVALANISEIVWGAHPPDEIDEREDVLELLPPDQLVFLMVLVEICHLEPDFTGFVEPAIADFVSAWLGHCWSGG